MHMHACRDPLQRAHLRQDELRGAEDCNPGLQRYAAGARGRTTLRVVQAIQGLHDAHHISIREEPCTACRPAHSQ